MEDFDEIKIVIPSKINENISAEELDKVQNCCGAYIITVKSGERYVGSSKTLRTRIQSHRVYNDPNIKGKPMKSVTVYLTKTHMDARIIEYYLIKELNPELNFEIRPDASTWKEGPKEKLLTNKEDRLLELLDGLGGLIKSLPEVKEVTRKSWITYQISAMKNFCAIKIKKDYLQIDLKIKEINDPKNTSFNIDPTQAWTFNRRIELYNTNEVYNAFEIIKQAYEQMK